MLGEPVMLSSRLKRHLSEQLSEDEFIFDLLTKPEIKMTKSEEQHVKKVAKPRGNTRTILPGTSSEMRPVIWLSMPSPEQ